MSLVLGVFEYRVRVRVTDRMRSSDISKELRVELLLLLWLNQGCSATIGCLLGT